MAHPLLNEPGLDGLLGHPRARRGVGDGDGVDGVEVRVVVSGADVKARGQVDPAQSQGALGRNLAPGR